MMESMKPIYILFSQSSHGGSSITYCAAGDTFDDIGAILPAFESGLPEDAALVSVQFKGERAEALHAAVAAVANATKLSEKYELEQLEGLLVQYMYPDQDDHRVPDFGGPEYDDMDGDAASAFESAGMGLDEDYGVFSEGEGE